MDKFEIKGIIKNSEWNKVKTINTVNDGSQKVTFIKYDSLRKNTLNENVKLSENQISDEE